MTKAKDEVVTMAQAGGRARTEAMTPEERSAAAKVAALARWTADLPQATHLGSLQLGDVEIPCAVLADGTRVITQWGFYRAIGRSGRPAKDWGSSVEKVAPFLDLDNLKPFVSEDLAASSKPVLFRTERGARAWGYRAELLPSVCGVYLRARRAGELLKTQEKFADACEVIALGLAHVGIVALVDEATGYQADRARDALATILGQFIAKELRPWVKTFPPDFYRQMFRLRGWQFPPATSQAKPGVVGKYTNDFVYSRLAPGVLQELKRVTPRNESGRLRHRLHQRLTEEVGATKLREHLIIVTTLMKAATTWGGFLDSLNRVCPRFGDNYLLELGEEDSETERLPDRERITKVIHRVMDRHDSVMRKLAD